MDENKVKDPLPENFNSIQEAAEFWDTHSLADYWDETEEVNIEVRASRRQRVVLATELTQKVKEVARREGVSVETLVNIWIAERLKTTA